MHINLYCLQLFIVVVACTNSSPLGPLPQLNDLPQPSCYRPIPRYPKITLEECQPLVDYLKTFETPIRYFGRDFPQTYIVKEAPRCQVQVTARLRAHDFFPGSDFGDAAERVLIDCAGPPAAAGHGRGGILPFRDMWETEVTGLALLGGIISENVTLEDVAPVDGTETS